MASVERTAYPRFKRTITSRELHQAFTPGTAEVAWVRGKARSAEHLLALVVLLKSYQKLGYFPDLSEVPHVVVEHVRGLLELGDEVEPRHDSTRTAARQRDFVRERLGVVYDQERAREVALAAIYEAVQTKDNPADLINVALEKLVKARLELPGYSTLDEMASAIRTEVNEEFFARIVARMDEVEQARLLGLLRVPPGARSRFDELKRPAKSPTISHLREHLKYLDGLELLGRTGVWLEGVPPGKVAHFAGQAQVLDAAEVSKVGAVKRFALLASLLHSAKVRARDELVAMLCQRMGAITKKAKEDLAKIRERHREESERLLAVLGEVLEAAKDAVGFDGESLTLPTSGRKRAKVHKECGEAVLASLEKAGGLAKLSEDHELVSAHHGDNYFPLLWRHFKSHRKVLLDLTEILQMVATSTDDTVLTAVEFCQSTRHRSSQWVPLTYTVTDEDGTETTRTVSADFASQMWQRILIDKRHPGLINRRHFEVCTLSYLTHELRTGDVAVIGSESYANLHDQLLSWEACQPLVAGYCAEAGLPASAPAFTAALKAKLTAVAARVDAGYPDNADLSIDKDTGKIVLSPRKGKERKTSAQDLEREILKRLPEWSLLDVLARTAYWLSWWRHFGPASGSDPKIRDKLARYVLTVFCYGTNAGPAQVARHMRQKVSVHELSLAGNQHITTEKLNMASADVIDMFVQLDLAHVWGDVSKAGVDGSQIDTWENNLLAETSIRYGGYGGIAYRHVSDTYIALFSHFIPCGVWEAVYLFEGLLKNESEVTVDIVHGDTQGQSLPVFGLAHMLGIELLPRIRNWKDLIFYRPNATVKYQHIDPLFGDPDKDVIDWKLIENHWPDLMRVVLSIREGRLPSAALLRKLGNESRRNRIYQAFRELGRAMRTVVLLRFLSEPELRESIQSMTNKVEAFHKFSAWLRFAGEELRDNDPEYQEKLVKFNELLANCLIFHTAVDITKVVNDLIDEGWEVDPADLATVTPYITSKTRRFGTWHLDMEPPANEAVGRLRMAA
ncbi:Tn3 family transposase [Streptomyces sp. b94]|uniref:Tn3 family transposase n=1 Tax=Streptomyces sp. b94 TaxID=1827634 RepID=UPI001B37E064|nr:Tn3 family transposase [Streptomyces sp. b94]MBQ1095040.1 Tn3 family transposase [Streptomyces sp. b94]